MKVEKSNPQPSTLNQTYVTYWKKPILIPTGVDVKIDGQNIEVKGPKGTLSYDAHPLVSIAIEEESGEKFIIAKVKSEKDSFERAIWGTTRSNISNLVQGVVEGFSKELEVVGVGYKVNLQGKTLVINVGFSHPVNVEVPDELKVSVEKNNIKIEGIDKALVGLFAANVRKIKKPEPYKGKGIKYVDEIIRRKAGKAAKTAE